MVQLREPVPRATRHKNWCGVYSWLSRAPINCWLQPPRGDRLRYSPLPSEVLCIQDCRQWSRPTRARPPSSLCISMLMFTTTSARLSNENDSDFSLSCEWVHSCGHKRSCRPNAAPLRRAGKRTSMLAPASTRCVLNMYVHHSLLSLAM